jgi:hypothetical protein
VKDWPLEPLAALRSAQALRSARGVALRWVEVARARGEAEEIAARARQERQRALGTPATADGAADGALAAELACGASSRAAIDRDARRMAREGILAVERAEGAGRRAGEADAVLRELEGRADALSRGAKRWAERRRLAREAALEREIEEAWGG